MSPSPPLRSPGSTASMPAHQSGKRDGSYRSFHTSSGGAATSAVAAKAGISDDRLERSEVGEHVLELALRVDETQHRPAEIREHRRQAVAAAGLNAAAPAARRLLEPERSQLGVAPLRRH